MQGDASTASFYVIKSEDIVALNYLPKDHPTPVSVEWIDRGTDRKLSPTRLDELIRTYHRSNPSPGIVKLRQSAGVRAYFRTEAERMRFAAMLEEARGRQAADRDRFVTAIFGSMAEAEEAAGELAAAGIVSEHVAMLWGANRFMDGRVSPPKGHRRRSVFAGVTAGGVAAAALGTAILTLPGVGPVAVASAAFATAFPSVATISGIIGATGAAMATMLSDEDVDEIAANHLEQQLRTGKIYVSVNIEECGKARHTVEKMLETSGGRIV